MATSTEDHSVINGLKQLGFRRNKENYANENVPNAYSGRMGGGVGAPGTGLGAGAGTGLGTGMGMGAPGTGAGMMTAPTPYYGGSRSKLHDPKVQRMANVAQLYFYDYYLDIVSYLHKRKQRVAAMEAVLQTLPEEERAIQWKRHMGRERLLLRKRRVHMKFNDFQILTQVGQGGYGQVFLARKSDTKEVCALKVLNKKIIYKVDEVRHTLTERDILKVADSEWLVRLLYSFQDETNLYLAMEFVPGGDYRTLLNNTGTLNPKHARFYISEMFASLDALHRLGYVHRDLKPENFLIDAQGHIKLTDFGLAAGMLSPAKIELVKQRLEEVKDLAVPHRSVKERVNIYRSVRRNNQEMYAHSTVGSPDYMAVEVLEGRQYDNTIDYWSLACILYETLVGFPPFSGATIDEIYSNLRNHRQTMVRPQYEDGKFVFSDRTWRLVQVLITDRPHRLSSFEQVKQQQYFSDVDWERLRTLPPPFVPDLDSEDDPGYFDDFTNENDLQKYKEVMQKKDQMQTMIADTTAQPSRRTFIGFTYRHSKHRELLPLDESSGNTLNGHHNNKLAGNRGAAFSTIL